MKRMLLLDVWQLTFPVSMPPRWACAPAALPVSLVLWRCGQCAQLLGFQTRLVPPPPCHRWMKMKSTGITEWQRPHWDSVFFHDTGCRRVMWPKKKKLLNLIFKAAGNEVLSHLCRKEEGTLQVWSPMWNTWSIWGDEVNTFIQIVESSQDWRDDLLDVEESSWFVFMLWWLWGLSGSLKEVTFTFTLLHLKM